jgi:hypothetical protein
MRAALIAGLLALTVAAPVMVTPAGAADIFGGGWGGHGVDTRGDEFDIKIAIYPDGSAAIAYAGHFQDKSYECDGLLLPISATPKKRVYREVIQTGTCISGAEVTLIQGKDGIGFSWRGVWEEKGLTAQGALHRTATN